MILGFFLVFGKKSPAEFYFGTLLIALGIRIGKSVLYYFTTDLDMTIRQVGLSACIFIGPLFYFYVKALKNGENKFDRSNLRFLLGLLILILAVGLIFPYNTHPKLWNGPIIKGIYFIWGIFTIVGLWQWIRLIQIGRRSRNRLVDDFRYLLGVIAGIVFITCTYQFAYFIDGFTYLWGSMIFTVSFYYLAIRALVGQKPIVPKTTKPPLLENAIALLDKLDQIMVSKKPFTNPKLKLDELCEMIGVSKHMLSRLLNEVYVHGFSHYIKEYRVTEARRLIESQDNLSLEGIGYEAGFNSKSAFFEAFKKVTGSTPAQYKKSLD